MTGIIPTVTIVLAGIATPDILRHLGGAHPASEHQRAPADSMSGLSGSRQTSIKRPICFVMKVRLLVGKLFLVLILAIYPSVSFAIPAFQ